MSPAQKGELIVSSSPHFWEGTTVSHIMRDVIIALLPAALGAIYFFGMRAAVIMILSVAAAVAAEWGFQRLAHQPITVADGSAVITGLLLAMNLPSTVPFWLPIIGSVFAIVVAKQVFGGLGHNFVNPALAARAFLLSAWPAHMTNWVSPLDAVTTATPLALMPNPVGPVTEAAASLPSYLDLFLGRVGGSLGETSALLLLLGAAYLLWKRVIDWRIPVSFLGTVALLSWVFGGQGGLFQGDPLYHLLAGGVILGAFFMATDYVSSPITPRGRWIFGIGCGLITVLVRLYGGYPEGVSYSILIMNVAAPLIDRFTVPTPFGGVKSHA